jgi:hypothetical protein
MVSGQPAVVSKGQVREDHGAIRWYRPETLMHGPLAHQAEHLPFKQVVPGSSPGRLIPTQTLSRIHASTRKRPHRLAWSRTSPFHGGNGGSNPPGDACNFNGLHSWHAKSPATCPSVRLCESPRGDFQRPYQESEVR